MSNTTLSTLKAAVLPMLCLMLFCGCVKTEIGGTKAAFGTNEKKHYKPVAGGHQLKLELVSKGRLFAGEGGIITFALINQGTRKVVINEWYVNEGDNVIISCQNWLPGDNRIDPDAWVKFDVIPKKPAWRYPLTLAPGNRIFVRKQLPFVDKLSISPGSERRYFVKGELNLTSLKLTSRPGTVFVRNLADKRVKPQQSEKSRHFGR